MTSARTFWSGKPCRNGHVAARYVSDRCCVVCARARTAVRYEKKRGQILEHARAVYLRDPVAKRTRVRARAREEAAKVKAERRAEYLRHRDVYLKRAARYAAQNPQLMKRCLKEWRLRNPDKCAAQGALRRARLRSRCPKWLSTEHRRAMRRIYAAARRVSVATGRKHHVDHIVPLVGRTVSGLHVPWNLQVLTAADNRRKSNRLNDSAAPG